MQAKAAEVEARQKEKEREEREEALEAKKGRAEELENSRIEEIKERIASSGVVLERAKKRLDEQILQKALQLRKRFIFVQGNVEKMRQREKVCVYERRPGKSHTRVHPLSAFLRAKTRGF